MSSARRLVVCLAFCPVAWAACADDGAVSVASTGAGVSSSGDASSSSSGEPGTSTGTPTTGEAGTTAGEPGYDPPEPVCGNGYLEAAEECDDANNADGDGCTAACLVPCGLELEVLELAPTAQSFIGGIQVSPTKDGGFIVVGRLREITVDQEMMSTVGPRQALVLAYDVDGALLWERAIGTDMLNLEINGGTADGDGDVLLVGTVDGPDAKDIWVAKLDGAKEGAVLWERTFDGAFEGADQGLSVAATADGDVVAVGQVLTAVNDNDVWVARLAGADGSPMWTTTWSGTPNDGYSVDIGGPVGVAPDGSVYVLTREFVSHDVLEATLLKFGPAGGEPLWTATPLASAAKHKHDRGPLAVGPDGEVVFGVAPVNAADKFWLLRYGPDGGEPTWMLEEPAFIDKGVGWIVSGAGIFADGAIVIGGHWFDNVSEEDSGWYEMWTARLDADGTKRCQVSYQAPGEDLVPPSLFAAGFAAGPDGVALATAERVESESSVWTGRFRPL